MAPHIASATDASPPDHGCGRLAAAWEVLGQLPDPEVPAISLVELGIVRDLLETADGVEVVLTPTYSGCPATEAIEQQVREALSRFGSVTVTMRRAPAWTTDWITPEGREKLLAYGIAPPGAVVQGQGGTDPQVRPIRLVRSAWRAPTVACPRCGSRQTEQLSPFGSTACKSLYRCLTCREPFEFFKPL
ncbi:ring-1,2-phenylacetyl-CoA epoxidase subunit PaaD [Roseateles sp. YR242]|uniref:1,2-phenylacetyl-CoA epoxidase subunit PaaD n=1 Tax=Roseateles sp. YR242 TaxID=1855305 RepID=UPI0008C5E46B|nr:1,2-phenylacetyl-CoA epoxidase subunit PaaD [Roseateles sp. YR242]SEK32353.1 ring-1,2-phenylacetyl-CoA epoxidase subunit PaaD [Roseateles sp. YR242]